MGGYFKRCFYPVGHGGFTAEFFSSGFVMVYDCGTRTKLSQKQENKIFTSFSKYCKKINKKSVIDVLFISHFDRDHVSFIERINKGFEIKDVYMPFLTECQRRIYLILYDEGSISHQLVSGTFEFSANTKIHLVKPIDDKYIAVDSDLMYPNAEIVESFCHKTGPSCKLLNWQYIPFMRNLQLSEDFLEKCKVSNIADIDLLEKAYVHGLNEDEMKKILSSISAQQKKLRKLYKNSSERNKNSIMLFSGCSGITEHMEDCQVGCCLYTGDADGANGQKTRKDILSLFKDNITQNTKICTLQIPHHGSASSWGQNMEKFDCKNAVIQYRYGDKKRPAPAIISHLNAKNINRIDVTDNADVYNQRYDLNDLTICKNCASKLVEDL